MGNLKRNLALLTIACLAIAGGIYIKKQITSSERKPVKSSALVVKQSKHEEEEKQVTKTTESDAAEVKEVSPTDELEEETETPKNEKSTAPSPEKVTSEKSAKEESKGEKNDENASGEKLKFAENPLLKPPEKVLLGSSREEVEKILQEQFENLSVIPVGKRTNTGIYKNEKFKIEVTFDRNNRAKKVTLTSLQATDSDKNAGDYLNFLRLFNLSFVAAGKKMVIQEHRQKQADAGIEISFGEKTTSAKSVNNRPGKRQKYTKKMIGKNVPHSKKMGRKVNISDKNWKNTGNELELLGFWLGMPLIYSENRLRNLGFQKVDTGVKYSCSINGQILARKGIKKSKATYFPGMEEITLNFNNGFLNGIRYQKNLKSPEPYRKLAGKIYTKYKHLIQGDFFEFDHKKDKKLEFHVEKKSTAEHLHRLSFIGRKAYYPSKLFVYPYDKSYFPMIITLENKSIASKKIKKPALKKTLNNSPFLVSGSAE
ncbi:hypothetical protein ACFL35_11640 [Candidatus Riflebacteria bacterium]